MNKLDELTEELNKTLLAAEQNFIAMALSVKAEVEIEPGLTLGFSRFKGNWCLYIVDVSIQSASRERKMKAVYKLEALRLALIEEHKRQTAEIIKALSAAQNFVTETSTAT